MGHIKRALQCARTYLLRVKMATSSAFIVQPNFLIKRNVFTASKSRTPLRTTGGRGSVVQTQAGFFNFGKKQGAPAGQPMVCIDCGYVYRGDFSALPNSYKCPKSSREIRDHLRQPASLVTTHAEQPQADLDRQHVEQKRVGSLQVMMCRCSRTYQIQRLAVSSAEVMKSAASGPGLEKMLTRTSAGSNQLENTVSIMMILCQAFGQHNVSCSCKQQEEYSTS